MPAPIHHDVVWYADAEFWLAIFYVTALVFVEVVHACAHLAHH